MEIDFLEKSERVLSITNIGCSHQNYQARTLFVFMETKLLTLSGANVQLLQLLMIKLYLVVIKNTLIICGKKLLKNNSSKTIKKEKKVWMAGLEPA